MTSSPSTICSLRATHEPAHEAGGPGAEVELAIVRNGGNQLLEVRDRGSGMSQTVLSQALLPFYSADAFSAPTATAAD